MNLDILDSPASGELTALMASDLAALEVALAADAETLKRRKDAFNALLARKFGESASTALVGSGKDTGTVHLQPGNGLDLTVTFAKKVEWDQGKLMAALNAMAPEDARHYSKIELKVDERKFTAAPPAVQEALRPARTVKVEKPKFTFKVTDAEAA